MLLKSFQNGQSYADSAPSCPPDKQFPAAMSFGYTVHHKNRSMEHRHDRCVDLPSFRGTDNVNNNVRQKSTDLYQDLREASQQGASVSRLQQKIARSRPRGGSGDFIDGKTLGAVEKEKVIVKEPKRSHREQLGKDGTKMKTDRMGEIDVVPDLFMDDTEKEATEERRRKAKETRAKNLKESVRSLEKVGGGRGKRGRSLEKREAESEGKSVGDEETKVKLSPAELKVHLHTMFGNKLDTILGGKPTWEGYEIRINQRTNTTSGGESGIEKFKTAPILSLMREGFKGRSAEKKDDTENDDHLLEEINENLLNPSELAWILKNNCGVPEEKIEIIDNCDIDFISEFLRRQGGFAILRVPHLGDTYLLLCGMVRCTGNCVFFRPSADNSCYHQSPLRQILVSTETRDIILIHMSREGTKTKWLPISLPDHVELKEGVVGQRSAEELLRLVESYMEVEQVSLVFFCWVANVEVSENGGVAVFGELIWGSQNAVKR